jgi:hypothetical protein
MLKFIFPMTASRPTNPDGANAYTNLAFFHGHASLYPTIDFTAKCPQGTAGASSSGDNMLPTFYRDTIFFINKPFHP